MDSDDEDFERQMEGVDIDKIVNAQNAALTRQSTAVTKADMIVLNNKDQARHRLL